MEFVKIKNSVSNFDFDIPKILLKNLATFSKFIALDDRCMYTMRSLK